MSKPSFKTAIFYWLATKYLVKINDASSLEESKLYFRQAIDAAAAHCESGYTDAMRKVWHNVNSMNTYDEVLSYATNMVNKHRDKLERYDILINN